MPDQRILVLGGTGFVGTQVVNRLAAEGYRVIVPTRRIAGARHLLLLPTVEVIEADVHDPTVLARLATDADAVMNLVGILNEGRSQTFSEVHVEFARKVIAACHAVGVRRYLHMSGLHADVAGPSAYLRSKGEAERLVQASGLDWTIFEPSVLFGRDDAFLNLFAKLARWVPVVFLAAADTRFQPIYVGDVAACFVGALVDDRTVGQRYALCGPKVYTLRELVRYAVEVAGTPRPVFGLPDSLGRLQATVLECLPGKLMSRDNLASMQKDSVCDQPFPDVFGFAPTALEAVVPGYLSPEAEHSRFDDYRTRGGR